MAFWSKDLAPQAHLILVLEARVSVESSSGKEEVRVLAKGGQQHVRQTVRKHQHDGR